MSEASLPFNEKIYPTNAKISSGKKTPTRMGKINKKPRRILG